MMANPVVIQFLNLLEDFIVGQFSKSSWAMKESIVHVDC